MSARRGTHVPALLAVLLLLVASLSGCDTGVTSTGPHAHRHRTPVHQRHRHHRHRTRHGPHATRTARKPAKKPAPRTYLVTRVVDGDTIELGNGQTVRLVGIDTPEVGECGYEAASANMRRLVLGRWVRLTISDEDRDRYGRLLRYVDVAGVDAGLRQIQQGFAIARYDSRDGYGYHPREPRYIAADKASHDIGCYRTAAPAPLVGRGCAPGYHPCVPPYPPDVDCSDVNGPIYVTGSDPHGLDADHDGVACE
jgi:endonuclease YncB( thermonuclease family)